MSLSSGSAEALQRGERGNVGASVGVVGSVLIMEKGPWKTLAVLPKSQESRMVLPKCIGCPAFCWTPLLGTASVLWEVLHRAPPPGSPHMETHSPHTLQGQLRSILLLRPHLFGMSHARAQPAEPPLALRLHSTTGAPHRAFSHKYTSFLSCSV